MTLLPSETNALTWDELSDRVRQDDQGKWDRLVPRDELRLEEGRLCFPRRYALPGNNGSLQLNDWSTLQLCQRLGVPTGYFRRCPSLLQDSQVNHWLRHPETDRKERESEPPESRFLLRAKGDTLRGFLTERYSPVGNADLMRVLAPALRETGYSIRWCAITDGSLHVRLTDERQRREVLPGDAVIAGLHLSNSEVGKRRVTVDTLVWRLVCLNGLIALVKGKSLFSARHVGLSVPELADKLPAMIQRAVTEGETVIERFQRATTVHLSNPEGVIATIASDWGLSQAMEERITTALLTERLGQQETLYGLVNAVTNVAQRLPPDDRYTLETLAGRLLESGPPAVRATLRSGQSYLRGNRMVPRESELSSLALFSSWGKDASEF
jgi:hypothetical protein